MIAAGQRRLVYEIVVTNPGTKSQGWHGIFYGRDGQEVVPVPGKAVDTGLTGVGEFVSVPCIELWVPCGMIHTDTVKWLKEPGGEVLMNDPTPWVYKLYVTAEGTKSEGWWGELYQKNVPVDILDPQLKLTVKSPMGPFRLEASGFAWGLHGWFHAAWGKS